jgi:PAS domain S-box-containing protein
MKSNTKPSIFSVREIGTVCGFAFAYFAAHQIAFFFPDSEKVIMLVWPAGGIGLAAFLLNPRRLWPALALAFYFSGILADVVLAGRSWMTGLGYMTGNIVESIGCAWLILYWAGDFRRFARIREILALLVATVVVNAFSSCIGAGTSVLTRGASFVDSWQSWYVADGLGILLIGPLIIAWGNIQEIIAGIRLRKTIEGAAFTAVWSGVAWLIFHPYPYLFRLHPYLLVALLAWPAIRWGQRGVTLALILLFAIAVVSPTVTRGPSPFGGNIEAAPYLLELQLFLGFLAAVGYLLAASFSGLKRAEEALRNSETKFRAIASRTPDHIIIQDIDLRYTFVANPQLGLTEADMLGKTDRDFLSPEDAEKLITAKRKVLETGQPLPFAASLKNKNGGEEYFEGSYIPKVGADGRVDGLIGYFRNTTERKRAESQREAAHQALTREKRFSETVLDSLPGIFYLYDSDLRLRRWNNNHETTMGFSAEELRGRHLGDWHPSQVNRDRAIEAVRAVLAGADPQPLISTLAHKDGRLVPYILTGARLDTPEGPMMLGVGIDISDRLKAEEALRERMDELDSLNSMARIVNATLSLEQTAVTGLEGMMNAIGPDLAFFFLRDGEKLILKEVLPPSGRQRLGMIPEHRVGECMCGLAVREKKMLFSRDIFNDPRCTWEECRKAGLRSFAALPLLSGDEVIGVIGIASESIRDFEQQAGFLDTLASQISIAFANARLFETARKELAERKRAEEALKNSEERMRLFFERQLVGMAITSAEKGWLQVNDRLCEMLGYSRQELAHRTWAELTCPEDLAPDVALFDRLLAGEINEYSIEKRFIRKNGAIVCTDLSVGCVRRPDGSVDYVLVLLMDITERKRAEEELKNRMEELVSWHRVTLGREGRVVELKKEVNELLATLGRAPRYDSPNA